MKWFITGKAIYARLENTLNKRERESIVRVIKRWNVAPKLVNVAFVEYQEFMRG